MPFRIPAMARRKLFPRQSKPTRALILRQLAGNFAERGYFSLKGNLLAETRRELAKRASAWTLFRRPILFLDWGAGEGDALLKAREVSPRIQPVGLALRKPRASWVSLFAPGTHPFLNERIQVGTFEHSVFPRAFDVIQSHLSVVHAVNVAASVENALNSLRKGGTFIMRMDELTGRFPTDGRLTAVSGALAELHKQGFRVTRVQSREDGKTQPVNYVRIHRIHNRNADLSGFYGNTALNHVPIEPPAR